ncbi:MAG: serine protease, subtilase family [Myxococcaceae bacterium]|nr:serine protease, subtilase family [Myxococcaceae bacterium]
MEVKGTAKDDLEPPKVELSVNAGPWTQLTLAADGGFSTQVTLPVIDAAPATITVRATDAKGREVKVDRAIKVDNVSPICAVTAPLDGAVVTMLGNLQVSLTASDGSLSLVNPRVSTDGAQTFTPANGAAGSYIFGWNVSADNGGSRDVVFRVDDSSGHSCEAKITVTVDNVKPTVAFASPDAGSVLGPAFFAAGGVLSGTASDGTRALKSVTLAFADAGVRAATVQGTQWTISIAAPAGDDFEMETATVVATDLADNTASATLGVTVDVVAPVLTITSPAANAKLNASSFTAGSNVALAWTLTDGDPQLSVGITLADGGVQSPPVLATAPTDNPKTYQPTLVATDRVGNSSTASVTFSVDRVAPTVTATVPANNTRMHVGAASVEYSEAMIGGAGLTLLPGSPGTWTTPQKWTVTALERDTVYLASTGQVADLHGNLVVASTFKFHTETWAPTSGAILGSGIVAVLAAAADQEGFINLVVQRRTSSLSWLQLDGATGAAVGIQTLGSASNPRLLVASRTVQPDLTSRRLAGLSSDSNTIHYKIAGSAVVSTVGQAFIPTPPLAGEGAGLEEFGFINNGNYQRGGRAGQAHALAWIHWIQFASNRWEIAESTGTGLRWQTWACIPSGIVGVPPTCGFTPVGLLSGGAPTATPTTAISENCAAHQVNDAAAMTRFQLWQTTCSLGNPCVPGSSTPGFARELVADPNGPDTFFSIEGTGPYQVRKVVLSAVCGGAWTNVGAPLTLPTQPRLVVIRGNPGLFYADASENLAFVTP